MIGCPICVNAFEMFWNVSFSTFIIWMGKQNEAIYHLNITQSISNIVLVCIHESSDIASILIQSRSNVIIISQFN